MIATNTSKPKYRNLHQVALASGVSFNTIQNLIVTGRIQPDAFVGNRPLFAEVQLETIRQALGRPSVEFSA